VQSELNAALFSANYRGKLVVVGPTTTPFLPTELSTFTPEIRPTCGPACRASASTPAVARAVS
jgi:hypothetical protein